MSSCWHLFYPAVFLPSRNIAPIPPESVGGGVSSPPKCRPPEKPWVAVINFVKRRWENQMSVSNRERRRAFPTTQTKGDFCVGAKDQRIDDVGFSDQAYFSSKPGLYVHNVLFRIWSWSLVAAKIRTWPAIGAVLNTNLAVQLLPDN